MKFGLTLPFDDWIRRKYDHYLAHAPSLKPRAGALEIFRDLQCKGVVQAVVSNSDRLIVDANLRAVGIVEPGLKTDIPHVREGARSGHPSHQGFGRTG